MVSKFSRSKQLSSGYQRNTSPLLEQPYPIQLDPGLYKGAWVNTAEGQYYSNGEEWITGGAEDIELFVPPWTETPEGWFDTGVTVETSDGPRRLITNKYGEKYIEENTIFRIRAALGGFPTGNTGVRMVGDNALRGREFFFADKSGNSTYRVRFRVRAIGTVDSKVFAGVELYNGEGRSQNNRYIATVGVMVPTDGEWYVYEGPISGESPSTSQGSSSFNSETFRFTILALLNYRQEEGAVVELDELALIAEGNAARAFNAEPSNLLLEDGGQLLLEDDGALLLDELSDDDTPVIINGNSDFSDGYDVWHILSPDITLEQSGGLWETVDRINVISETPSLVGLADDLSGSGNPARQPVSAKRPEVLTYPPGHPMEGVSYFNFDFEDAEFEVYFSGGEVSGVEFFVCTEFGIYSYRGGAQGRTLTFGKKSAEAIFEVFAVSGYLNPAERVQIKADINRNRGYPIDNFNARSDWSNAFSYNTTINDFQEIRFGHATNVDEIFRGCTGIVWPGLEQFGYAFNNALTAVGAFRDCSNAEGEVNLRANVCLDISRICMGCASISGIDSLFEAPLVETAASAFEGCVLLEKFENVSLPSCTNFSRLLFGTESLERFAGNDISAGENFSQFMQGSGVQTFEDPLPASATTFQDAWYLASRLATFSPGLLDAVTTGNFVRAFRGCALTQGSVDNILTSLATAAGANSITGGTLDIDGGTNAAPSVTGEAAIDTLRAAGWTVTVAGGY